MTLRDFLLECLPSASTQLNSTQLHPLYFVLSDATVKMGHARTTSPTALLWAHQLKREHNHLMIRIKTLEAANSTLGTRMSDAEKSAQDAAKAIETVDELSARVQAIEEDDKSQQQRFGELDRDRGERFEKLGEGVKKVEKRLQTLEKDLDDRDEESQEKKEIGAQEKQLLVDRLDKLEREHAKLKEMAAKGEKLTRKDDAASTKVLNRRIEALEARRNEEGSKVKSMLEKFEKIEKVWSTTQGQLKRALDKMEAFSSLPKRVATPRPTPHVASSSPCVVQVPESPSAGRQTRRSVASHPQLCFTVLMISIGEPSPSRRRLGL